MASIVEVGRPQEQSSGRQRWSHNFVLIYAAFCLIIALNLRASILEETVAFSDVETGIRARYPADWLIDQSDNYVFRVRDISRVGFKTSIQVSVQPVSLNTTTRNLLDALSLSRAQTLTAYRILDIEEGFQLEGDVTATRMRYVYVDVAPEATLQRIPTVVEAFDLIAIREGQAIIISFQADADAFEDQGTTFERFVDALEF